MHTLRDAAYAHVTHMQNLADQGLLIYYFRRSTFSTQYDRLPRQQLGFVCLLLFITVCQIGYRCNVTFLSLTSFDCQSSCDNDDAGEDLNKRRGNERLTNDGESYDDVMMTCYRAAHVAQWRHSGWHCSRRHWCGTRTKTKTESKLLAQATEIQPVGCT